MQIAISRRRANNASGGRAKAARRRGRALFRPYNVKQLKHAAHLVPATHLRPGLETVSTPDEGWAERRQAPGCSGIRLARNNVAGRGACETPLRPSAEERAPF